MKTFIKILGISLLATIIYIIVSAVMPFSQFFKELSQDSNPTDLIYLLIVHTWITGSVFYIGKKSEWNKKWLHYSIILVFIAVYGFMTQIETLFFHDSFKALSKSDGWLIMLTNIPLRHHTRNHCVSCSRVNYFDIEDAHLQLFQ